ncbi:MAG: hypothetical protein L3J37_01930 [Rhodobacteraceae bacterium]|nr:hypothetical protein [Paracoccaceae bacterium]
MEGISTNAITAIFERLPQIFFYGFGAALSLLATFIVLKVYFKMWGNKAHNSYQQAVVAPVQYGSREAIPAPEEAPFATEEAFSQRLENMAEAEDVYDLSKLKPQARQLGAIANTTFRTAPVLDRAGLGVLTLIEAVMQEVDAGFRVLMHVSLESLVDLEGAAAQSPAAQLSMVGIDLKFAVVDRYGRLLLAIRHEGEAAPSRQGHINRTILIEILRKAGVWYLEIPQNYSYEDARAQILAVLRSKAVEQGGSEEVALMQMGAGVRGVSL